MRKFLCLIGIVIFFCTISFSQPNYTLKTYTIRKGEKPNYYIKEGERYLKKNEYNKVVMNGAYALKIAVKKNHISSAQKQLNKSYTIAIQENIKKIELLKENTLTFQGDKTVNNLAEILNLYTTMYKFNTILRSVKKESFLAVKKRKSGFTPKIEEYTTAIATAKEKLENGKKNAAQMHYKKGSEFEIKEGKLNHKKAANHFLWASMYSENFKNTLERYKKNRVLGTTRIGIVKFKTNASSQYGDIAAIISNVITTNLLSYSKSLLYFEVVDRDQLDQVIEEQRLSLSGLVDESTTAEIGSIKGVDVLLVGNVMSALIDRQETGPDEKVYEKEIVLRKDKYTDSNGKEKTKNIKGKVKAKAKVYTKHSEGKISFSYKIIDVKTGAILLSNNDSEQDSWKGRWVRTYTGDSRALPNNLGSNEPTYPSYSNISIRMSNSVGNKVFREIRNYAKKVGL